MSLQHDFTGRRVLVTGAADGIGRATATAFQAAGASVMAVDSNAAGLGELARAGMRVLAQDVSAHDAPERIGALIAEAGGLEVLVNNAGICPVARLEDTSDEVWDRVLDVDLRAMFRLCRMALPWLRRSGYGRIVNIASISALLANEGMGAYTAAKHGVAGLSKSLAAETGVDGITVNYIIPGAIVTGITRDAVANDAAFRDFWIAKSSVGRWGEPRDIANAILFLAAPESSFVTGHGLVVDGGASIKA
ncbi:MAG: SDR family NAD(P)-dependent oxidoreductase [Gammaproteobacteria bacterium]